MCTPFITHNQVCTVSVKPCFYYFTFIKIQITAVTYVLGLSRLFFCYAVGTEDSLAWPPEKSRNCISFSHTEGGRFDPRGRLAPPYSTLGGKTPTTALGKTPMPVGILPHSFVRNLRFLCQWIFQKNICIYMSDMKMRTIFSQTLIESLASMHNIIPGICWHCLEI